MTIKARNFTLKDDGELVMEDNWDDAEQAKLAAEIEAQEKKFEEEDERDDDE